MAIPADRSTAFLFDLDGTLVDSVYQHVLAWHEALDREAIPLSVWRIHRRIGMSGGLFANALLRELGREITPELTARLRAGHAQAFLRAGGRDQAAAGRGRAAANPDRARDALGDRDQRPARDGGAADPQPGRRSGAGRDRHPRPGPLRQARSRPVPDRGRAGSGWTSRIRWWWATACGTCWPPGAPGRSAWGCSPAATARTSWSARAPTGSMPTRPTFCAIWTRSASVAPTKARRDQRGNTGSHRASDSKIQSRLSGRSSPRSPCPSCRPRRARSDRPAGRAGGQPRPAGGHRSGSARPGRASAASCRSSRPGRRRAAE